MYALGVHSNRKMDTKRSNVKVTKSVRILQKIKGNDGVWHFVPVKKSGSKYLWGDRPGTFFLEWSEGLKRRRESVGISPSEALEHFLT